MSREVTVPREQSVYRVRIEASKTWLLRREGWRWIVERRWSMIPESMMQLEHWKEHRRSRLVQSAEQAIMQGNAWLDLKESLTDSSDYI